MARRSSTAAGSPRASTTGGKGPLEALKRLGRSAAAKRPALFRRVPADPIHIELRHEGEAIRVALKRRPTARRITLRVSGATGEVVLTLPETVGLDQARRFLSGHGEWIATRLAKVPERVTFVPNATIPFKGVPHRIMHWSSIRGLASATVDARGRPVIAVSGDPEHTPRRVRELLEKEAKRALTLAARRHCATLGVTARRITVRDTKSRWGSCSSGGSLNFSWRLIMAPPFVLDYLAAHEVAHLREMNHSPRFWRLVHRLCARTEEAETWLRRQGTELHRYG